MSTMTSSSQEKGMKVPAASDESKDKFKDDMLSVRRHSLLHFTLGTLQLHKPVTEPQRSACRMPDCILKPVQILWCRLLWGVALPKNFRSNCRHGHRPSLWRECSCLEGCSW